VFTYLWVYISQNSGRYGNEEKRRLMRSVKARLETMEAAERQPTGKVQKPR